MRGRAIEGKKRKKGRGREELRWCGKKCKTE